MKAQIAALSHVVETRPEDLAMPDNMIDSLGYVFESFDRVINMMPKAKADSDVIDAMAQLQHVLEANGCSVQRGLKSGTKVWMPWELEE